ncbi:hypothetical protein [Pantoea ananatis]|uniref:fimbrial biogenesis chaperone n=1 Tax=Pantoea ananas TaxID=553 RepID=UPI003D1547AE
MQIKMFVRPPGLSPGREKAAELLTINRLGANARIHNPTPYYLPLINLKAGITPLQNVMVPPKESVTIALPAGSGRSVTWEVINDYGGLDKGGLTLN